MYDSFNSTFISLIPKSDDPQTFNDFRPISLCNCIYNIIAKIIANCLKPVLSAYISRTVFFPQPLVDSRSSWYSTIGSLLHQDQEIKGMILKIDLAKVFYHTSWLYLKILLTHLTFPLSFIQWIMCCISNVSYSVLINGSASPFFHAE